jgi:LysM repeat protein
MFPILALILAGCFRQASDPVAEIAQQPVADDATATVVVPQAAETETTITVEPPTEAVPTMTPAATQPDDDPTEAAETPTEAATTPAPSPTEAASATDAPTQPIVVFTATPIPTNTPAGQVNPVPLEETTEAMTSTPTANLITPSLPGGDQSAITTPTPMVQASNTPSGLITPTDMFEDDDTATESPVVDEDCIYVVQAGDNLFRIALNNNTTVNALIEANPGIDPEVILVGQEIILPNCEAEVTEPDEDTTADSGEDTGATGNVPIQGEDQGIITGVETVHVVQAGETLWTISRRYGVTVNALIDRNELINPNQLSVGQEIVIPATSDP